MATHFLNKGRWSFLITIFLRLISAYPNLGPALPGVNFPDPSLSYDAVTNKWWSFGTWTQGSPVHIQAASSSDFFHWTLETNPDGSQYDALPIVPSWVPSPNYSTWDPALAKRDDGSWIMYYAAGVEKTAGEAYGGVKHAITYATSQNIRGPYQYTEDMLIFTNDSYGDIGVMPFKDWDVAGDWTFPEGGCRNSPGWWKRSSGWGRGKPGNSFCDDEWSEGGLGGTRYLTYKIQNADNDTSPVTLTPLALHQLTPDGTQTVGEATVLLNNDGIADDYSVEGPNLFKTADASKYFLTFSIGNTVKLEYTTHVAVADYLTGPYIRTQALLSSGDDGLLGPGSMDLLWDGRHMVFAAWETDKYNGSTPIYNGTRDMYAGLLSINDQGITVDVV